MDFTELIRKSNLAKKEITKTRQNVEEIKTALIENGVDQIKEDTKLEEIGTIIKETDLGSSEWKRPKKWIEMPNIVQEDSVYIHSLLKKEMEKESDISLLSIDGNQSTTVNLNSDFVNMFGKSNPSKVQTGTDLEGNFNVSANDFAYVMLYDISSNNDENILSFEGTNVGSDRSFTKINEVYSGYGGDPYWSDLFIQIDDEIPFNLSELARGNIGIPTSGKYKGICILNEDISGPEPEEIQPTIINSCLNHLYDNHNLYSIISLLISLDYNDFSEETLNNGKKQCVIKIWGHSFIELIPAIGSPFTCIINRSYLNNISNINNGIKELSICQPELLTFLNSYTLFHLFLVYSGNINLNKVSIYSNLSSVAEGGLINSLDNIDDFKSMINHSIGCCSSYINDYPNTECSIKELDLTHCKCYDSLAGLFDIQHNSPTEYNYFIPEIFNKLKNVERITFPDINVLAEQNPFLDLIKDKYYCIDTKYFVSIPNKNSYKALFAFCINLSTFIKLNRDCIIDIISKLPIFDKNMSNIFFNNILTYYENNRPQALDLSVNNNSNKLEINDFTNDMQLYNGNKDIIKTVFKKEYGPIPCCIISNSVAPSSVNDNNGFKPVVDSTDEEISPQSEENYDSEISPQVRETTLLDMLGFSEDQKLYNYIMVSQYTYDLLTQDDLNIAQSKGWKIFTGYNFIINKLMILK